MFVYQQNQSSSSAVDRLKLAACPNITISEAQKFINQHSENNMIVPSQSSPRPIPEDMLMGLTETLSGLQQLNMHAYKNVSIPDITGKMTGLSAEDDSPRSMFGFNAGALEGGSLFDGYGQEGPHEEDPPSPVVEETDPMQFAKYVCQREKKLFKTEMCLLWIEKGFCEYGSQCKFAHHDEERRSLARHPKFKTKVCRHFAETGACPFGRRCHFLHGNELTPSDTPPSTPSSSLDSPPLSPKRLPIFQTLAQG
eukprot:TRINITY_DN2766_c0_g1_i12.p2 TRINITY_DN2766_c0_g1~~TRINITY_DN2766_c0_g1_i12.p2  ORF type:complete len:253 (+),score=34.04 TRINITY_DN2766_c0_g1_i12:234-992(+)